ncbi:riboflavin synthase [Garciella nitratireducens]|uniref:Riboflavin synthase n=1 Tax=Garciella nitratireducens DSM 15102 TaxID=1121911 RepID=A0A1T4LH59_9FIRM|nr:riboflavin synthase [Garciella nitratireducens]SJZ54129.1 riboflavin synthase alpha chain [Garciella nitratireducens DSM 15102]
MFTGLIEEIGMVQLITKGSTSSQITIKARNIVKGIQIGDSISTNGVCLTVTNLGEQTFSVDVMPETMRNTNLKNLAKGSPVNLERALRLKDRLGGHIVSGHIDGVGIIQNFQREENATWVTISTSRKLLKYVIPRGSIAIDGTSLTVAYVNESLFKVSIIPHTKETTILLNKKIGDEVNLEVDVIGKYLEKLIFFEKEENKKDSINLDFLRENGFC